MNDRPMDRRQFFAGIARSSLAAGLTATGVLLVLYPHGTSRDCAQPILCGRCRKFDGCDLPKAQRTRSERGGANA